MPELSRRNQWLQRLGDGMRRHAPVIRAVQWAVVLFYALLLVIPAVLPLPDSQARLLDNLTLFAQFLFWGIWWPFVLLSIVLFGRLWCGVLCPEGSLSEWASHYGKGLGVPRWLRWGGWPTLAFCLTTLYGQLISVYDYAQAALLILGGSTVAAVVVGLLFARGKRVWCRYLCPVSGVFALLARLAPVHFQVDEQRWMENAAPRLPPPNCAPLLDIRRMQGASDCHACGRCSGQRGAVQLIARSSNQEILHATAQTLSPWDARLLLFGVIGLAMGAFQWTVSPWFVALKQTLAAMAGRARPTLGPAGQRALVAAHPLPAAQRQLQLARRFQHRRLLEFEFDGVGHGVDDPSAPDGSTGARSCTVLAPGTDTHAPGWCGIVSRAVGHNGEIAAL